jgi:mRNA interferase MazF
MATARFRFGDVVLVPFPFTDQTGAKKRPAVVVSSSGYNSGRRDIVIMAITSQVREPLPFGETMVSEPVFATIEQGLVIRNMGALSAADAKPLHKLIVQLLG